MKEMEAAGPGGQIHNPTKRSTGSKDHHSKNPYSDRGLDKFSDLLAHLDGKREQIYSQRGSDEIFLVHFVYSSANDCKPIVVKAKDKKPSFENSNVVKRKHTSLTSAVPSSSESTRALDLARRPTDKHRKRNKTSKWSSEVWSYTVNWWKPCYFFPAMVILILLFLALFGRSFAILCTSIVWYLVPTIKACNGTNTRKPKTMNKEHVGRPSLGSKVAGDGLSPPGSVLSPRQHARKKS